ncbi:Single-stranded DNA-binding protein [Mactra antiquata]
MLRRLISKAVAVERSTLPYPALTRVLHTNNYCTSSNDTEVEEPSPDDSSLGREKSFINVTMLGRVGSKPLLYEGKSFSFVNFAVGTLNGNRKDWHRIQVKQPNIQQWLLKYVDVGDRVIVKGNLKSRSRDDETFTYIAANEVMMIHRSPKNRQNLENMTDELPVEKES